MDKYINLTELRQTAEALLAKINELSDSVVKIEDVTLNQPETHNDDYTIGSINNVPIKVSGQWLNGILSDEISTVYSDIPNIYIIQLTYYDTINGYEVYQSAESIASVHDMISNGTVVILRTDLGCYYFVNDDSRAGQYILVFSGTSNIEHVIIPYKMNNTYSNYWYALDLDIIPKEYDATTNPYGYLTMDTLPIYDGSVT